MAAFVAVGAVVGIGATLRDSGDATAAPAAEVSEPTSTTTTAPAPTTTTVFVPPALVQPAEAALPPVPPEGFGIGDEGPEVLAYEQRLAEIKTDPGPVDGVYTAETAYAVQAVQKIVDQERDGVIGPLTAFALAAFKYPEPLAVGRGPNRAEADLTKQVLTLYEAYQVRLLTTVSSGSGERYCYNTPRENPTTRVCEDANTPSGDYEFYEFRSGWDKSPLGQLYNPFYFNGGIAVHGYESVPTSPASHGCVRIPMHIAEYFHDLVGVGTPISVFGGTPANVVSREPLPPPPPPEEPPPEPVPTPEPTPDTATTTTTTTTTLPAP